MKILNEYPGSHHYIEEYEKCDLFCPACGKKSVWEEQSPGDYDCGPQYICAACESNFTIQGPYKDVERKASQLKSGVMLKPTTPRGN